MSTDFGFRRVVKGNELDSTEKLMLTCKHIGRSRGNGSTVYSSYLLFRRRRNATAFFFPEIVTMSLGAAMVWGMGS
jgi:hypothetical protein